MNQVRCPHCGEMRPKDTIKEKAYNGVYHTLCECCIEAIDKGTISLMVKGRHW